MEAIAIRLEAMASRLEAIATRLEAIAIRLEAMASRLAASYPGRGNNDKPPFDGSLRAHPWLSQAKKRVWTCILIGKRFATRRPK